MNIKELELIKKPFPKRLSLMLIGVVLMGVGVAVLNMTNFGVDPYSAFCYGVSYASGISFGTISLSVNTLLLLIVVFFDIKKLGFGTLGNMIIVGYTADFTTYIMRCMGITHIDSLMMRIIVMLITISIFIFAVALYVNAGLGASAYDVIPYIIHEKICKMTNKPVKFKYIRIAFDAFFTIIGFLLNGAAGVITVLMVIALGPTIEYVSKLVANILFKNGDNTLWDK